MALAQSRLTAQGQISVPAEIRRRLGIGPGAVLEWDQDGDRIFVRKVGKFTSDDVHLALFPKGPPKRKTPPKGKTLAELKEGIKRHIRGRHARG